MQQPPQQPYQSDPMEPRASYPEQPSMPPYQPQYVPQQPYQQQSMYPQQPQPAPMPMQPMMQPPMPAQTVMQNVNVNIQTGKKHGMLSRSIYFICIGWWFGFFWFNIGYALCLTVIGLPLGLVMLNRLPAVLTLRPSSANTTSVNVSTATVMQPGMAGPVMAQTVNVNVNVGVSQHNFLLRAVYFVFIGSWVGYFWALLGYSCCISVVLLPVGLMMLNRLPAVITLRKN